MEGRSQRPPNSVPCCCSAYYLDSVRRLGWLHVLEGFHFHCTAHSRQRFTSAGATSYLQQPDQRYLL